MEAKIYVQSSEIRTDRRGSKYLAMVVRIKAPPKGEVQRMDAKSWSGSFDEAGHPKAGFRYLARGELQLFNGARQFIVSCFSEMIGQGPYDLVETPAVDQQATYRRLFCCAWEDLQLSSLFSKIHDALGATFRAGRSLLDILWEIPAGAKNHHNRRAGLLQHISEMVDLADCFCIKSHGWKIQHDVLVAAILLHDLGKVYEYSPETFDFESTDVGERFGHTCWLPTFVASLVGDSVFEGKVADVMHAVLSHHGIEGGAPVKPKTPEANMLNLIDQMSAKLDVCRSAQAAADRGEQPEFSAMLKATPLCIRRMREVNEKI